MKNWTVFVFAVLFCMLAVLSCSGGGNSSGPVTPGMEGNLTASSTFEDSPVQTHLWGYYDIYIDIPTQTVYAELNRSVMFAANVVTFLNNNPSALQFNINDIPIGPDYIDVDIDVGITHPFPGMTQYNGYDVRGVFIGDGSATMDYNSDLDYAVLTEDQYLTNPDGYTRWFNPTEFSTPGLFGYTPGLFASKNYTGNATLNPYKYYADGLSPDEDVWAFLVDTAEYGVFASGSNNMRNYYLNFPNSKGVNYGYAVVASWVGEDPDDHPANAPEPVGSLVNVYPDLYYVNETENGGNLILDLSLKFWEARPSAIFIESTVLNAAYELSPAEMVPIDGNESFSTWHVEIPSDEVTGLDDQEFWVIAEAGDYDYQNGFGVPNSAGEDTLAAFFRYALEISPEPMCPDPEVTGIDPDYVLTGLKIKATITGLNMLDGSSLAAMLVKSGEADIVATDVTWIDDLSITADFDLQDAAEGFWDVEVTNGCGKTGTGSELLEVFSCGTLLGFTQSYNAVIVTGYPHEIYGGYCGMAGTQTGTPYVIGITRMGNELGAMLAGTGSVGSTQFYYVPPGAGQINRDIVCDSENNVYFTDASNFSRVRYCPFNSSTGFGTASDFGNIGSGYAIWRITIDEDDNPVVLGYLGTSLRVFHWDEGISDWNTTDIPGTVGPYSLVGDFDWNPLAQHYVFTKFISPTQSDLYAVDLDGNEYTHQTNIFNNQYCNGLPGLYIDVNEPGCRVVAWGSHKNFGTKMGPFVRMTAAYQDAVVTSVGVGNFTSNNLNVASPRGQVAVGSNRLIVGCHYINVWGKVPLPGDW